MALAQASILEPRHATLVRISTPSTSDQAVVTSFPAPASYTGEDVVEISAHGSPVILRGIVQAAIDGGARLAQRGGDVAVAPSQVNSALSLNAGHFFYG